MSIGKDQIEHRFGFHKGTEETIPQHREIRLAFRALGEHLDTLLPDGREKALVFTALQEAAMWSNCAVAMTAPLVSDE